MTSASVLSILLAVDLNENNIQFIFDQHESISNNLNNVQAFSFSEARIPIHASWNGWNLFSKQMRLLENVTMEDIINQIDIAYEPLVYGEVLW